MARRRRPYLPGTIFHLTARTQGREHWFDAPMRDFICEAMAIVQPQTDAKLKAFVVMSNHLHVVLRQGRAPLAAFMQPLLCRVALAVKRKHGVDGHVFSRAYWDGACTDEAQLRATIEYIHHNPVRAGLCTSALEWRWSSCRCYLHPHRYWRPAIEPAFDSNDTWCVQPCLPVTTSHAALDLRDLLMFALRAITDGQLTLTDLRCMRGHASARIRRQLMVKAAEAGYRGSSISRVLGVSEATVSKAIRAAKVCRPRLIGV